MALVVVLLLAGPPPPPPPPPSTTGTSPARGLSIASCCSVTAAAGAAAARVDVGDRRVVITGDGPPSPALTDFCRDSDLLVSECSGTAEFLAAQPWGAWHTNPQTLAAMATEANVQRVVIKHLVMEDITGDPRDSVRMGDAIREGYGGEVLVGEDGLSVDIT